MYGTEEMDIAKAGVLHQRVSICEINCLLLHFCSILGHEALGPELFADGSPQLQREVLGHELIEVPHQRIGPFPTKGPIAT